MISHFLRNLPPVIKNLLIINVLFFIATFALERQGISLFEILGMHYPASPFFKPVQLVSYMFLHGGIAHIFFNMIMLLIFGPILERVWGPKKFLIFYFATGIGAVLLYIGVGYFEFQNVLDTIGLNEKQMIDYFIAEDRIHDLEYVISTQSGLSYAQYMISPMVGASGAIFGVLTAFGVLFPNTELIMLFFPIPIKAKYLIPFMILLELYLGIMQFSGDNIAHFAHLGGALIGYILLKFWKKDRNNFY